MYVKPLLRHLSLAWPRILILAATALLMGSVRTASAELIGVSLSYDGMVKVGNTSGFENHDLAPIFPPNPATVPLTDPMPQSPLQPGRSLSATMTEFADAFMGQLGFQHVVIVLQGQGGGTNNAFVNPLNPDIPLPVAFDASFYSDDLPLNQMLMLAWAGVEDGNDDSPFPAPGSVSVSGVGTQVNPWRVQLGIAANMVSHTSNGWAKIHLYYKTGPLVPEPAAVALAMVGIACVGNCVRRRRIA